jgi:hypothetical protein
MTRPMQGGGSYYMKTSTKAGTMEMVAILIVSIVQSSYRGGQVPNREVQEPTPNVDIPCDTANATISTIRIMCFRL